MPISATGSYNVTPALRPSPTLHERTAGATPAGRSRGFTLIELLVTAVVIAIAAGLIVPRLSWIRSTPPLEAELRDLAARIELARDEAALQGRNFGVRFYPDGYRFLDLDPDSGAWVTLDGDDLLAGMPFPEDSLPGLRIDDRRIELEPADSEEDDADDDTERDAFGNIVERSGETPHIVILASGEVTPFSLALETVGDDAYARLDGDFLGQLSLSGERQ